MKAFLMRYFAALLFKDHSHIFIMQVQKTSIFKMPRALWIIFLFTLTPFGKKKTKACWKTLIAWLPDCLPLKLVSASECLQTEFGKDR